VNEVAEAFCRLYLQDSVWMRTFWLGTQVIKCPLDLWMYQEIVYRTRPDVIIETGTWNGGSAHFLACICDLLEAGRVITIDIEEQDGRPPHPRLTYLTGSSVAPETLERVRDMIEDQDRVMVILDSDHAKEHVLAELRSYQGFVSDGCYLIVEDTAATKMIPPFVDPGPAEAIDEF
jgi:cephalosporin hydroxylase